MRVDIADPQAAQSVRLDKREHFIIGGDAGLWQPLQRVEYFVVISKIGERQFTGRKRMTQYSAPVEHSDKCVIGLPKVIDPDRAGLPVVLGLLALRPGPAERPGQWGSIVGQRQKNQRAAR